MNTAGSGRGWGRSRAAALGLGIFLGACEPVQGQDAMRFALGGQELALTPARDGERVFLRGLRPVPGGGAWAVDVVVSNGTPRVLKGPVVLRLERSDAVDGQPLEFERDAEGRLFRNVAPLIPDAGLGPGQALAPWTMVLPVKAGVPRVEARLYVGVRPTSGLAMGRTLDGFGLPLEGVEVTVDGREAIRSGRGGWFTVATTGGRAVARFSKGGHALAWREVVAGVDGVAWMGSPRLPALEGEEPRVLTAQALPAPLPSGWSPVAAMALPDAKAATVRLVPVVAVGPMEGGALVRWDEAGFRWQVLRATTGGGTNALEVLVERGGVVAWVIADDEPKAPGPVVMGEALPGVTVNVPEATGWKAEGRVNPAGRPASVDPFLVTAWAEVDVEAPGVALPSGVGLACEVTEEYRLRDGTRRVLPRYQAEVAGFQKPGLGGGRLRAVFPMRPFQLLPGEELAEAVVRVDVSGRRGLEGGVLGAGGGELSEGGVRVRAGDGDLGGAQVARLRTLPVESLDGVVTAGTVVSAFELDVAGVTPGRSLRAEFVPDLPDRAYVLGRFVFDSGRHGLQPVARLRSDGSGRMTWEEPATGRAGGGLDGMDGGGLYGLVRMEAGQAVVAGVARGTHGKPLVGVPVRVGPWLALTGADGSYRLLAPAGPADVRVTDLATGDTGVAGLDVDAGLGRVERDVTAVASGPRVARVNPASGATSVARVTPVEVFFDEPVMAATVVAPGAVVLRAGTNEVPASVSLSPGRTILALLPSATLPPEAEMTLTLARTITDGTGLGLEGTNVFRFVTESDRVRRTGLGLEIHEPADGLARMVGGPGIADPKSPVILVNETTGETSTVVSRADGSFNDFIRAGADDRLRAVLVNRNGTRTELAPVKQYFRDGSVGLFSAGGEVAVAGETGEIRVTMEPGAVQERAILKLEPMRSADFEGLAGGVRPTNAGPVLGAFVLGEVGDEIRASMDVSFPVEVSKLGLPPGTDPTNAVYAVVFPVEVDGKRLFQIADTAEFVAEGPGRGRIVTQSPPFTGILARKLAQAARGAGLNPVAAQIGEAPTHAHQGETLAFGILPLSFSQGLKVAGKVVSVRLDGSGRVDGTPAPVSGAIVRVLESRDGAAGLFSEGDVVSVTDDTGHFGFFFRPFDQAGGRGLVATHPRYPFQQARSGGFAAGMKDTTVASAELRFVENPLSAEAVVGTERPVLKVSNVPELPRTGTGDGAGATLTVVAVDDVSVSVPTVAVTSVVDVRGATLPADAVTLESMDGDGAAPVGGVVPRRVSRWNLRMKVSGRVTLRVQVADDGGRLAVAEHVVVFGGAPAIGPQPGDDAFGPRVIFSWPPSGSTNVPSLTPIRVRLNEPVPRELLEDPRPSWVAFGAGHFLRRVEASGDRRELTIWYDGDREGPVRLTFGVGLKDEAGNLLDQDDAEAGKQPFLMDFEQSGDGVAALPGAGDGGGVVLLGRYAYGVDRAGAGGRLVSQDLMKPDRPVQVAEVGLTERPTALALIPRYALPRQVNPKTGAFQSADTNDLLAVFTGSATEPKRLRLVQVANGQMVAGVPLGLNGGSLSGAGNDSTWAAAVAPPTMVVQAKWDPPFLGYFELGADVTSVVLLNLTAFQVAAEKRGVMSGFPLRGDPGLDANEDGDYADEGDRAPLPMRSALQPPGLAYSFAPATREERIQDFDFSSGLGLVVTAWGRLGANPACGLRVVLAATTTNDLGKAVVELGPDHVAKRVTLLPAQEVVEPGASSPVSRDLAIVSLARQDGGTGALAVVDVTEPFAPVLRRIVPLPPGEGGAQSVQRRADGLLAVATSQSTLLVEPRDLLMEATDDEHPAFRGRLDGVGNGVRAFVADVSGLNITQGGSRRQVVVTEPRFQVVRFPGVVNPLDVAGQTARVTEGFLKTARRVDVLEPMYPPAGGGAPAADPARHYYVLVDAPGGAGGVEGKLRLAAVAVDRQGRPQAEKGGTMVPAVVGDRALQSAVLARRVAETAMVVVNFKKAATEGVPSAVQRFQSLVSSGFNLKKLLSKLGELGKALKALPPDLVAHRLSSDPNHPLFNRYLAGPWVILGGAPTADEVASVARQSEALGVTRPVLRPSPRLWVGLASRKASEMAGDPQVLDRFTARFRLHPRLTVLGVPVPESEALVEAMARLSQTGGSGPRLFEDLGDQAAAVVGLLTSAPFLGSVLKGELEPTLYPGAHVLARVNHNDRPLVLVPGFAGSKLHMDGAERWLGGPGEIFGNRLKPEMLSRPDGTPVLPTEVPDALRFLLEAGPVELGSIYGTWIEHLKKQLGYVEYDQGIGTGDPTLPGKRRRLDGLPRLGQDPTPDLFVFPYDWRVDNQKSAEQLREYVRLVRELHPDADGIDLVGHSNGGLVARAFLLLPGQRPLVRRLVTVATPWLGAPKILSGLASGDLNEMSLNLAAPIGTYQRLLQFYPAAHQLVPSREYFDMGLRPLIEDGYDVNTNGLGHQVFDFAGYQNAIGRHLLMESAAAAGLAPLIPGGQHPVVANMNAFRAQKIADHRQDGLDVEMHHVFGMGCTPDTIGQLRLVARLIPTNAVNNAMLDSATGDVFEPEEDGKPPGGLTRVSDGPLPLTGRQYRLSKEVELRFVSGDGTVPVASLSRGAGSAADLNAPHAKVHAVVAGFGEEESGHNPMLNTDQFLRLFSDVITGREVDHLAVSISAPTGMVEGGTGTFGLGATGGGASPGELSWVVDFGDGTVELRRGMPGSLSVEHRYRQNGNYVVSVGVTTDKTDTERARVTGFTSRQVTVANAVPTVRIEGVPGPVNQGDSRMLTAVVTDAGLDDSFAFRWQVGGDRWQGRNQFAIPVTFSRPGQQVVEVEVEDQDGGVGRASLTVEVLPSAPQVGPFLGDSARPPRAARLQSLPGFEGGQPEIQVRIVGVAGLGEPELQTPALILRSDRDLMQIVDPVLNLARLVPGNVPLSTLAFLRENLDAIRTTRDRFLGKYAHGVEMVREVRSRTVSIPLVGGLSSLAGQDLSSKRTWVAGLATNRAWMMDVTYLKGGEVQKLYRWSNSIASGVAFRLRWDWVAEEGRVEFVPTGGVLEDLLASSATVLSNAAPIFVATSPAMAADRLGPAVTGILNPATDRVEVLARDNFTPATSLPLYLAYDSNENGRLDDEVFHELSAADLPRSRLTSRPFAIISQDQQGNIGDLDPFVPVRTANFLAGDAALPNPDKYRKRLDDVRQAIRGAVAEGLNDPVTLKFLLEPGHFWLLEQGSGAGLWASEDLDEVVKACNGNYVPGKSDNDYEIFLPTRVGWSPTLDAAAREAFLATRPLNDQSMAGDWYFKRPQGRDASGADTDDEAAVTEYAYLLPEGRVLPNGDDEVVVPKVGPGQPLSAGFTGPFTPAEAIAMVLRSRIGADPARAKLLPDTTFYAERQEYLTFGKAHISRPQAAGDDTLGDAAMGRQLLMLKWALEGAFVTHPGVAGLNATLPLPGRDFLDAVHGQWTLSGVPLAEGYEWGVYHEFAALSARPTLRANLRFGTTDRPLMRRFHDDALAANERAKIKKLGKAAIRAALARLAGDPAVASALTDIAPTDYRRLGMRSYEEYVLETLRGNARARAVFGSLADDRDDREFGPDLGDWLKAKKGHDEGYFQLLLSDPALHQRFVRDTFDFLRNGVQAATRAVHAAEIQRLVREGLADEASQRMANLHRVVHGAPGQPGLLELARSLRLEADIPVEVSSWGPDGYAGYDVTMRDPGPSGNRTVVSGETVAGGAEEAEGDDAGEVMAHLMADQPTVVGGEPVLELAAPATPEQTTLEDDSLSTVVESMPVGTPQASAGTYLTLYAVGPNRRLTVLFDWAAQGRRARSPMTTLGLADRIEVMVMGAPGLGGLTVLFKTDASANVLQRSLAETSPGSGIYELAPGQAPVRVTLSEQDRTRLFVPDENVVEAEVLGLATGRLVESVMIDASELAIAAVKHTDRPDGLKPRLDFREILTLSPSGPRMFLQGYHEFRDDILPLASGEHGQMRQMIQDFAGPAFTGSGEADWLYVHAHGSKNGSIFGHDPIAHASDGVLILDPVRDLASGGRWSRDADYFISEACSILNPGIDRDSRPLTGFVPGLKAWEQAMRASPRPIHGVLGFMFGKVASRADTRKFIRAVGEGQPIGLSWVRSMNGVQREWAWLFFRGTEDDTLYWMQQDPDPTGPMDSLLYRDVFGPDLGDATPGAIQERWESWWPGLWAASSVGAGPWQMPELPGWLAASWSGGMQPPNDGRIGVRSDDSGWEWGWFRMPRPGDLGPPGEAVAVDEALGFLGRQAGPGPGTWRVDHAGVVTHRRATADGGHEERPVVRRVHARRAAEGVPVLGSEVSLDVGGRGVNRASGTRGWLPAGEAGPRRPVTSLWECAARWWNGPREPMGPVAIVEAELAWAPRRVDASCVRLVPVWRLTVAAADATGAAVGDPWEVLLDAVSGGLIEEGGRP